MKVQVSDVLSTTEVNKLRKRQQVKSKKVAPLTKHFRRLKERSKGDHLQKDLLDAVARTQRISKAFLETLIKEIPGKEDYVIKQLKPTLELFDTHTKEAERLIRQTLPNVVDEIVERKNLPEIIARGYKK
ncbi:hypothetical protein LEN26_017907 [Aphanomyces euteiches]|nr:hypothetical protein LEN26_017907 [Aphanomyces euteiches]KAH9111257.1 hypothetical protein AeMF1_014173 [Aphanomyces euteiches]KAH9186309.1 hypothetical protein AeNC1_011714 [Aphanomyces euteiches]